MATTTDVICNATKKAHTSQTTSLRYPKIICVTGQSTDRRPNTQTIPNSYIHPQVSNGTHVIDKVFSKSHAPGPQKNSYVPTALALSRPTSLPGVKKVCSSPPNFVKTARHNTNGPTPNCEGSSAAATKSKPTSMPCTPIDDSLLKCYKDLLIRFSKAQITIEELSLRNSAHEETIRNWRPVLRDAILNGGESRSSVSSRSSASCYGGRGFKSLATTPSTVDYANDCRRPVSALNNRGATLKISKISSAALEKCQDFLNKSEYCSVDQSMSPLEISTFGSYHSLPKESYDNKDTIQCVEAKELLERGLNPGALENNILYYILQIQAIEDKLDALQQKFTMDDLLYMDKKNHHGNENQNSNRGSETFLDTWLKFKVHWKTFQENASKLFESVRDSNEETDDSNRSDSPKEDSSNLIDSLEEDERQQEEEDNIELSIEFLKSELARVEKKIETFEDAIYCLLGSSAAPKRSPDLLHSNQALSNTSYNDCTDLSAVVPGHSSRSNPMGRLFTHSKTFVSERPKKYVQDEYLDAQDGADRMKESFDSQTSSTATVIEKGVRDHGMDGGEESDQNGLYCSTNTYTENGLQGNGGSSRGTYHTSTLKKKASPPRHSDTTLNCPMPETTNVLRLHCGNAKNSPAYPLLNKRSNISLVANKVNPKACMKHESGYQNLSSSDILTEPKRIDKVDRSCGGKTLNSTIYCTPYRDNNYHHPKLNPHSDLNTSLPISQTLLHKLEKRKTLAGPTCGPHPGYGKIKTGQNNLHSSIDSPQSIKSMFTDNSSRDVRNERNNGLDKGSYADFCSHIYENVEREEVKEFSRHSKSFDDTYTCYNMKERGRENNGLYQADPTPSLVLPGSHLTESIDSTNSIASTIVKSTATSCDIYSRLYHTRHPGYHGDPSICHNVSSPHPCKHRCNGNCLPYVKPGKSVRRSTSILNHSKSSTDHGLDHMSRGCRFDKDVVNYRSMGKSNDSIYCPRVQPTNAPIPQHNVLPRYSLLKSSYPSVNNYCHLKELEGYHYDGTNHDGVCEWCPSLSYTTLMPGGASAAIGSGLRPFSIYSLKEKRPRCSKQLKKLIRNSDGLFYAPAPLHQHCDCRACRVSADVLRPIVLASGPADLGDRCFVQANDYGSKLKMFKFRGSGDTLKRLNLLKVVSKGKRNKLLNRGAASTSSLNITMPTDLGGSQICPVTLSHRDKTDCRSLHTMHRSELQQQDRGSRATCRTCPPENGSNAMNEEGTETAPKNKGWKEGFNGSFTKKKSKKKRMENSGYGEKNVSKSKAPKPINDIKVLFQNIVNIFKSSSDKDEQNSF